MSAGSHLPQLTISMHLAFNSDQIAVSLPKLTEGPPQTLAYSALIRFTIVLCITDMRHGLLIVKKSHDNIVYGHRWPCSAKSRIGFAQRRQSKKHQ